jgi:F0F1-type ATP synthase assembly protein I
MLRQPVLHLTRAKPTVTPGNMDDIPNTKQPKSPELAKAKKYSSQTALAMELPFTIVGAVLLGGLLGYFLDHWLHTKLIFTLLLGALGFAGGLKEVLRRLAQSDS